MSAETPTNPYSAFEKMTDEEVVLKAKEDNVLAQEYLLHKYRKFVRAKARSYRQCAGSGIFAAQIP